LTLSRSNYYIKFFKLYLDNEKNYINIFIYNFLSELWRLKTIYLCFGLFIFNGGSSYKEFCECVYDRGLDLMSVEEKRSYERDFAEIEDAEYMFTAPLKFLEANAQCMDDAMQEIESKR